MGHQLVRNAWILRYKQINIVWVFPAFIYHVPTYILQWFLTMLFHKCLRILPKVVHCKYSLAIERSAIDKLRSSNKDVIVDCTAKEGVAFLAMNYQTKKNALSKSFVSSLSEAVKELEMDSKSKVAIICSLVL
uniref:Uncharacterized protein n=1 Tax=Trichobilharzia regenti TaxID=157069 RepID=A0AA85K931_TRIRE|nr:unnamed protein product [Trichobilharzia regenti]